MTINPTKAFLRQQGWNVLQTDRRSTEYAHPDYGAVWCQVLPDGSWAIIDSKTWSDIASGKKHLGFVRAYNKQVRPNV